MDTLQKWFDSNQGRYVDVIIAEQVFGGRLQESPQMVRELSIGENSFTMRFATTETLVVTNPSGFLLGEYGQLIVPHADEARFGWHYYGRPQIPQNWCQLIYRKTGNSVEVIRHGPSRPGKESFHYTGDKFVELTGTYHRMIQMPNIIGRWSTAWFYHDPANEVLVFLPGRSGVFEYHWWTLNFYETFSYRVEDGYLYLTGNTQYTSDSEGNTVEETPSDIDFSGRFRIREPNPEESAAGCEVILEFETPLIDDFPATKKLGRRVSDADVSEYRLPLFARSVPTRSKSDQLQRRGRPARVSDSTAYSKGRPIPRFDPLYGPFGDIRDEDLQLGPCAFCGESSVTQVISRVRCERCGRVVCWKCADCGVFSSLSDFQKFVRRRTDSGKDVYLPAENCPNCQEMSWWDKHARPSSSESEKG